MKSMNNRFVKLLTILSTLPLLMGASLPSVYARDYNDYELTYLGDLYFGEDICYTYNLKNTGNGYISSIALTNGDFYDKVTAEDYYGKLFNNTCFNLDFDGEINFIDDYQISKPEKPVSSCSAYFDFADTLTISGTNDVRFIKKVNDTYLYGVDLSITGVREGKFNYGAILELTYDSAKYSIVVNDRSLIQFTTSEELDLTKLSVDKATAIRSSNNADPEAARFVIVAIIVCYIVLPATIFCAIFFSVRARRRRRRRALLKTELAKKEALEKDE